MIPDQIQADRVEPDEEALFRAPAPEFFIGPDEGFLGEVLRFREAAGHPVGQVEDGGLIGLDEKGIDLAVPPEDGSDDLPLAVMKLFWGHLTGFHCLFWVSRLFAAPGFWINGFPAA